MTRKDYKEFAAMVKRLSFTIEKPDLIIALEGVFKQDNPKFDADKFLKACIPDGLKKSGGDAKEKK